MQKNSASRPTTQLVRTACDTAKLIAERYDVLGKSWCVLEFGGALGGDSGYISSPTYHFPRESVPTTEGQIRFPIRWHLTAEPGSVIQLRFYRLEVSDSEECDLHGIHVGLL